VVLLLVDLGVSGEGGPLGILADLLLVDLGVFGEGGPLGILADLLLVDLGVFGEGGPLSILADLLLVDLGVFGEGGPLSILADLLLVDLGVLGVEGPLSILLHFLVVDLGVLGVVGPLWILEDFLARPGFSGLVSSGISGCHLYCPGSSSFGISGETDLDLVLTSLSSLFFLSKFLVGLIESPFSLQLIILTTQFAMLVNGDLKGEEAMFFLSICFSL
jgi:hypothetical protein